MKFVHDLSCAIHAAGEDGAGERLVALPNQHLRRWFLGSDDGCRWRSEGKKERIRPDVRNNGLYRWIHAADEVGSRQTFVDRKKLD